MRPSVTGTSSARVRRWRRMLKSDGRTAGRPPEWQVLVDAQGRSGERNMAADERLLNDAGRLGRRFFACTAGIPQLCRLVAISDRPIAHRGAPVVRRPTGGRAVWHEHEVTYAVTAPIALSITTEAYREIHTRLAAALRSLGIDAVLRRTVRPSDRPTVQRPVSRCRLG